MEERNRGRKYEENVKGVLQVTPKERQKVGSDTAVTILQMTPRYCLNSIIMGDSGGQTKMLQSQRGG